MVPNHAIYQLIYTQKIRSGEQANRLFMSDEVCRFYATAAL